MVDESFFDHFEGKCHSATVPVVFKLTQSNPLRKVDLQLIERYVNFVHPYLHFLTFSHIDVVHGADVFDEILRRTNPKFRKF